MDSSRTRASGIIHFLTQLLSLCNGGVECQLKPYSLKGRKLILFQLEFEVEEKFYEICQELAMERLLKKGKKGRTKK